MSRPAYRLWTNKFEDDYKNLGFTDTETTRIINFLYDVDEDYTSKKEYLKAAQNYAKELKKETGLSVGIETLFGMPVSDGYRYCSKCQQFFWEDEDCGCEE